jgi:hypothetical protein
MSPLLAVNISALAYGTQADIDRRASEYRLLNPRLISADGTECLIANTSEDAVVVAFRGTQPNSYRDLKADIKAKLVKYQFGPGKLHAGFAESVQKVWRVVNQEILRREPSEICLTGHSKGGAEATILAAHLGCVWKDRSYANLSLITFGSPRVGNGRFTRAVESKLVDCQRYVNCCDVVTRVPSRIWYRHIGPAHYFNSDGRLLIRPPRGWITFDRLFGRWLEFGKPGTAGLVHHGILRYRTLVERMEANKHVCRVTR